MLSYTQPISIKAMLRRPVESAQYLAIRYTERLAEAGAVGSVGSRGDPHDNALAEAVNGLYTAEVIRKRGPWRSLEQVELATAEWVDWWNHRRLHSALSNMPPAEFEALYHHQRAANDAA
jgi:putative transposase